VFRVSDRSITIVPKRSADELQDEQEIRDPKVHAIIKHGYEEFLAGRRGRSQNSLPRETKPAGSAPGGVPWNESEGTLRRPHVLQV
jgi:hypothetical protein